MAFIPVTGAAQFNIRATVNDIPMENVLHFVKEDSAIWDTTDLTVALSVLGQAWQDFMLDALSVEYVARTIYARDLALEFGAISEYAFLPDSTGVVTGDALPGNVAACITHRTGQAGRSFRGRTYIGGLAESQVTLNELTGPAMTAILGGFQAVIDEMSGSSYSFVIASRYTNNAPRTSGIFTVVQSSSFRDAVVDTQRRRLR